MLELNVLSDGRRKDSDSETSLGILDNLHKYIKPRVHSVMIIYSHLISS